MGKVVQTFSTSLTSLSASCEWNGTCGGSMERQCSGLQEPWGMSTPRTSTSSDSCSQNGSQNGFQRVHKKLLFQPESVAHGRGLRWTFGCAKYQMRCMKQK